MQAQTSLPADSAQLAAIQRKLQLDSRFRSGIGWFYWIAALSLVNTIVYLLGAKFSFVVGVGIDLLIAGMFALIGYFGRKRIRWPVITGMGLYGLDAILMLLLQDFLGAAFHAWALYGIWTGLGAMRKLELMEKAGGQPAPSLP